MAGPVPAIRRGTVPPLMAGTKPGHDDEGVTVMAGLVPAILRDTVPPLMAGTSPAMTMKALPAKALAATSCGARPERPAEAIKPTRAVLGLSLPA